MKQILPEKNTEEKILGAARKVFMTKGLDGARMQDIADTAGINKALLHYYFRSKEKLFQKVFMEKGRQMVAILQEVVDADLTVREKISILIDREFEKLKEEPMMSFFIISEMNRNPDKILQTPERDICKVQMKKLFKQIKEEIAKGTIRKDVHAEDIVMDLMSMMHFPGLARPLMTEMFFDGNHTAFAKAIDRRKEHIKNLVLESLEP